MKSHLFHRHFVVFPLSALAVVSIGSTSLQPTVHYKTYQRSHGKVWLTKAQVPVVKGVSGSKQLNQLMEDHEQKMCRAWVKDAGHLANTWTHTQNVFQREVRAANVYPLLFTYVSGVYSDTGGAHPGYMFDGSKYAFVNGHWQSIKVKDFFVKDFDWASELNSVLVPKLKDKGAMFLWNGMVKSVPVEDMENVVATPTGFRFYVNPYDVGPWAQGQFIVNVSYSELKGLRPGGPISQIAPSFRN